VVCGERNRVEWHKGMPTGSFGGRLQGLIGYLSGRFKVGQRDMAVIIITTPFGRIAELMSALNKAQPFILNFVLFIVGGVQHG
jgi:hypothetical protein